MVAAVRLHTTECDCAPGVALIGGRRVEHIDDPATALHRFRALFWEAMRRQAAYHAGDAQPALRDLHFVVHCRGQHVIGPR